MRIYGGIEAELERKGILEMGLQLHHCHHSRIMVAQPSLAALLGPSNSLLFNGRKPGSVLGGSLGLHFSCRRMIRRKRRCDIGVVASSNVAAPFWDGWKPEKSSATSSISDVLWPAAGAFASMAILGKMDQVLASKGISITIAPLGAVCAVLFASPSSPAARKYNMFMAQIGCAAIGVLAFSLLGPGWLARSAALGASIAFMIYTRSTHPPAASLPLLFIDGAKFHPLNFWFALFPGATACIFLCLMQEVVSYLKQNLKF